MKRIFTVAVISAAVLGFSVPAQAAEAPVAVTSLPTLSISGAAGIGA